MAIRAEVAYALDMTMPVYIERIPIMASQRPFRFGVINEQLLPPAEWLVHVRRVEELGYSTFLIRDHMVPDYFGEQYAPLVALAAAAGATGRLRLGTMVLDNDFRHPAMLAKEAATLDALSGGRLELGIGAGWLRNEYERAGMPFDTAGVRIERLEEALRVIDGLWAGGPFSLVGRHYQIDGLELAPLPAQRPRPPIFLGGGHRRMLTMAGRMADIVGLLTTSVASGELVEDVAGRLPAAIEQKLGWIRDGAGERYSQIELSLIPTVILTDDRDAAIADLIAERGWPGVDAEQVRAMPSVLVGSVEQVAADMQARRERYGFSYYVFSDLQAEELAPLVERLGGR
jgi:probable F420-dependent oxidoreductase